MSEVETDLESWNSSIAIEDLPGIYLTENTNNKLKFYFKPIDVIQHVDPELKFKCTVVREETFSGKSYWNIRYNSFPVDYRMRIYRLFWTKDFFRITDLDLLNQALEEMYQVLLDWACREEQRMIKLERDFRAGLVELHELDEKVILTPREFEEATRKRDRIWARMIPPPGSILSHFKPMRID